MGYIRWVKLMKRIFLYLFLLLTPIVSGQILPGVVSSSASSSDLLPLFISAWELNETGAGANAIDNYGITTLTNTSCTTNQTGQIGKCFQFTGSSSLGGVNTTYEYTTAVTVSIWFKTSTAGSFMALINDANSGADYGYDLNLTDAGYASWAVYDPSQSPAGIGVDGSTNLVDGNWHQLVATFGGTYAKLYVDSVKIGTSAAWNHNISYAGGSELFNIGLRGYSGIPYTGYIDMPRVTSNVLTDAQVHELYLKEKTGTTYPW